MTHPTDTRFACSRRGALLTIAGAVAQLTGCGGGGTGVAGLSSGGTGSFTSGTITGFGSIIVNGIRYNNDTASVYTSDDTAASSTALQLGMVVTVEGSAVAAATTATGLPTATATRITYGSEWTGPVSNITTTSFDILGHTVDVLASTVFSGAALQLANLSTTHFVEVYGYVDQLNGHIQASRIEVGSTRPSAYRLSGAITQLNVNARTAQLGPTSIGWAATLALPTGLSSNNFVRVTLDPVPIGATWTATRITVPSSPVASLSSHQDYEAEIHGSITAYTSSASFTVNGIAVNAASAQITGTLGAGAQVEVSGRIQAGQLIATQVQVKDATQAASQEFEFYGPVSNLNTSTKTFVVHGQTFSYDSQTVFSGVNFSQNPTPTVAVKARTANGGLYAYEIDLED